MLFLDFKPWWSFQSKGAAISVSPETNTKPKKRNICKKRRKTPGDQKPSGKRLLALYSYNKKRTFGAPEKNTAQLKDVK